MTRTKILHIRINEELKRALSKRAYDENRTMSNLIERLLKREIEKWKAETETPALGAREEMKTIDDLLDEAVAAAEKHFGFERHPYWGAQIERDPTAGAIINTSPESDGGLSEEIRTWIRGWIDERITLALGAQEK